MISGFECSIFGYEKTAIGEQSQLSPEMHSQLLAGKKLANLPAETLIQQAWIFAHKNDAEIAKEFAETVLGGEPDTLIAAEAHVLIGNLATQVYEYKKAENHFLQATSICRKLDHAKGMGISLQSLASLVYFVQGQVDLAMATMEEANYHLVKSGSPAWGYPLLQAYMFESFGDRPNLIAALDELILQITPGSYAAGVYFLTWAKVCLDDNELQKADEYLQMAFHIANQVDLPDLSIFIRNEKSRAFRTCGQLSIARNWAEDAANSAKRIKNPYLYSHALTELGQVFLAAKDFDNAKECFSIAIKQFRHCGSLLDAIRAEFLLTALYQNQKKDKADRLFLDATDQIIKIGYTAILYRDRKLIYPLIARYLKRKEGEYQEKANALLSLVVRSPSIPLRILGLGQFQVWQGQHLLPDHTWSKRKSGVLFRFLLIQPNRTASREMIMDALWPDLDPKTAADTLYQSTSTLRRGLEPDLPDKFPSRYLSFEGEKVILKLPLGSYTDFNHFEMDIPAAIKNRKMEELQQLIALHEGELFPMDRYVEWVGERRNRLEALYLQGLNQLGALYLISQDYYQGLEASQKMLKIDPWNEDAVLMGMQAYLGLNNAPRALILYEEFRKSLEKELGIKPRPDIRELADEIVSR